MLTYEGYDDNPRVKFRYFCCVYYLPMNEDFRQQVLKFFKSGMHSSGDKLAAILFENYIVSKNARKIADQYTSIQRDNKAGTSKEVTIKSYAGSNPVALKIRDHLQSSAGTKLVGAYVHGSIATSEEIAYSD